MLIIDSLLKCNFFSLERCRRTSLFLAIKHTTPVPRSRAWPRRRSDWSETSQRGRAAVSSLQLRPPAAELCRGSLNLGRKSADEARAAEPLAPACTARGADGDCPLGRSGDASRLTCPK